MPSVASQTALRYRRHRQPPLLGGRPFLGGKSLAETFKEMLRALAAKILRWKPEESLEHAKCSEAKHAHCDEPKEALQVSGGLFAASLLVLVRLHLRHR